MRSGSRCPLVDGHSVSTWRSRTKFCAMLIVNEIWISVTLWPESSDPFGLLSFLLFLFFSFFLTFFSSPFYLSLHIFVLFLCGRSVIFLPSRRSPPPC